MTSALKMIDFFVLFCVELKMMQWEHIQTQLSQLVNGTKCKNVNDWFWKYVEKH